MPSLATSWTVEDISGGGQRYFLSGIVPLNRYILNAEACTVGRDELREAMTLNVKMLVEGSPVSSSEVLVHFGPRLRWLTGRGCWMRGAADSAAGAPAAPQRAPGFANALSHEHDSTFCVFASSVRANGV